MDTDLHAVIRANILEDIHKRYIIYQLLKAIKYMHSAKVIHRDLKPSNLLINCACLLKVADFSEARSISSIPIKEERDTSHVLTHYYASTRWYRAPEVLLGSPYYAEGVDIWGVGCILGELIVGKPIFPGQSSNQLDRIIEFTGRPTHEDITDIQSVYANQILETIETPTARSQESMLLLNADSDTMDLLRKLLTFSPVRRITATQALAHPYVAQFHVPEEEIEYHKKIFIPIELRKLSVPAYRDELFTSIIKFNFERQKAKIAATIAATAVCATTPSSTRTSKKKKAKDSRIRRRKRKEKT
jgi:mitogen-activated protein kinase 15